MPYKYIDTPPSHLFTPLERPLRALSRDCIACQITPQLAPPYTQTRTPRQASQRGMTGRLTYVGLASLALPERHFARETEMEQIGSTGPQPCPAITHCNRDGVLAFGPH